MNLGWEDLENIQSSHWQLKESDRILNNFHSFEIFRDDKLSLKLKITYKLVNQHFSEDYFYKEPERRAGEVYVTDGFLILENIFDENVMLEITGITLINKNIVHNEHEIVATITCAINNLKKSNDSENNLGKDKFTIDWITNLDIGNYHWSSSVNEKSEKKTTRDFKSVNNTISFTENRDNFSSSSNCCNIRINNLDIFFGRTDCPNIDKKYNPGFILYSEKCNSDLRKKIRNALSFILGCKLIHISSVLKDENYNSVEYEIHTQSAINDLYHSSYTLPPSPLHPADTNYLFLGENEIGLMVQKIVTSYDDYDFSHFSWLYWHAVASPLHLKGVGFGASLEFIQRKYIENNATDFNQKLISKALWKPLYKSLSTILEDSTGLSEDEKRLLSNKLSSLNQTPHSILTSRFYELLNLSLGDLELISFKQRNNSAHGNKSDEDGIIPLVREVKILRILCNRIILRIYNLSDYYNDFYSLGFQTRHLSDSIPK
ncbi:MULTISPECIES: hypothetical protein [Citrobacter]|uniref:hypothetical protein n=1 Tax=Citrobacter TaxID=544 RepID=UPI0025770CAA|nr:hypothetical protein [Citrobacter sp. Cf111]MDM3169289.1 hypothetical protein [Citrobacter sp. Cf111]